MSEVMTTEKRLHLVIEPKTGWASLRLDEVWQFRDLLMSLAGRDLKVRYKQTVLGVLWVVLQPLITAGIFTIVFGKIAGMQKDTDPSGFYFVLAYSGQLAYNLFNWTVLKSSECLLNNAQLVSKVFFPRLVLPFSTVISTLVDVAVGMALLVVLVTISHFVPGMEVALLPVVMALLLMMGLGVGLFASAMTVKYRDMKYVLPVAMQMLMYATPVMYAASRVPEKWRWFVTLNPLTPLIEGFRYAVMRGSAAPDWHLLGVSAGVALVVFVFGLFSFKRMERSFADVI